MSQLIIATITCTNSCFQCLVSSICESATVITTPPLPQTAHDALRDLRDLVTATVSCN